MTDFPSQALLRLDNSLVSKKNVEALSRAAVFCVDEKTAIQALEGWYERPYWRSLEMPGGAARLFTARQFCGAIPASCAA